MPRMWTNPLLSLVFEKISIHTSILLEHQCTMQISLSMISAIAFLLAIPLPHNAHLTEPVDKRIDINFIFQNNATFK
jgi:hypothetical protein